MFRQSVGFAQTLGQILLVAVLSTFTLDVIREVHADSDPHNEHSPTLARVFSAWKARQERVKSLHIVWDTRIVLPKGAYAFPRGRGLAGLRTWGVESDGDKNVEFTLRQSECGAKGAIGCGATSASLTTAMQAA
jgi:hypothetical protein